MKMETSHKEHLETRIKDLTEALQGLTANDDQKELVRLIRQPWWTTPAEFAFAMGIMNSLIAQVENIVTLKQALLTASREVREL